VTTENGHAGSSSQPLGRFFSVVISQSNSSKHASLLCRLQRFCFRGIIIRLFLDFNFSSQSHKVCFLRFLSLISKDWLDLAGETYTSRRFRLLPMHRAKHLLQLELQLLVLSALVEFAYKMSSAPQCLLCKLQGR
jgi:hypothetical protein